MSVNLPQLISGMDAWRAGVNDQVAEAVLWSVSAQGESRFLLAQN